MWFGNEVNVRHAISKRRGHGGRGKEASARYEKSMADARVRHKTEASVNNRWGRRAGRTSNQLKKLVAGEGFEPSTFGL